VERGDACVAGILSELWNLPLGRPQWSTVRLWLMRHYKLTRPKEQAADWVWLIDHSVQIGPQKCLVILGVRLSRLPAAGECLRYDDLEPIVNAGEKVWRVSTPSGETAAFGCHANAGRTA